jgi:hypothetical protein
MLMCKPMSCRRVCGRILEARAPRVQPQKAAGPHVSSMPAGQPRALARQQSDVRCTSSTVSAMPAAGSTAASSVPNCRAA